MAEFIDPLSFGSSSNREEEEEEKDDVEVRPQPVEINPVDGFVDPVSMQPKAGFVDPTVIEGEPAVETQQPAVDAVTVDEAMDSTYTAPLPTRIFMKLIDSVVPIKEVADESMVDIGKGIPEGVLALLLRGEEGWNNVSAEMYANNLILGGNVIPRALSQTESDAGQQASLHRAMDARKQLDELVQNPETPVLQRASRDVTRFVIPYLLFRKGIGTGSIKKDLLVTSPLADLAAFTTTEERLSGLVADADIPGVSAAVEKYLATDPDDSTAQAVFKQSMEGVFLGGVAQGTVSLASRIFAGAKHIRSGITGRATGKVGSTQQMPGERPNASVLEQADSIAATEAEAILSQKIRLRPGDDPAEVATNLFKDKLQEKGIWDTFPKVDQDAKLLWFFKRSQKAHGKGGELRPVPPEITSKEGQVWEKQWEDNVAKVESIKEKQTKKTSKKILESLEASIVDRSGPFRRMLEKSSIGQRAGELFALARGASTKAALVNKDAVRIIYQEKVPNLPIWRSVGKERRALLDKAISIRRFRHIKALDTGKLEKGNPISNQSAEFYDKRLEAMRADIGEEAYMDVMKRADHFFSTMRSQLDELLDGGVITGKEYQALSRFQFSPTKYIEELDKPIAEFIAPSGKPISVSSSGIQPLGKGAKKAMETDTEIFLQEVIVRSTSKAMKNRANLALFRAAESDALPGIKVSVPKGDNKLDWTKITVMDSGKPKNMHIAREYAEMWAASPESMDQMWRILGHASGASLVRLGATGPLNPEFALSNFPRDMVYNILVSDQYSGFLPKAVKEWGDDFADVWKDAVTQTGRYKDYINEGGGMEFLTHQGIPGHAKPAHTVLKDWQDAFSYTNTTSEIINRLTTRERALKNILKEKGPDHILTRADKEHATFIARTTIDFDQGGTAVKALNEIVPYLNASVQGMRGYARSFKTNPVKAGAYAAQLMGIYGSMAIASRAVNPEAHAAVPDYVNKLFVTMTTPYSIIDSQGDTRYLYFKMPIDHSTTGLKILSDSLVRATFNQGLPNEKEVNAIGDFGEFLGSQFGIVPGATLPPAIGALMAYGANYDWWRQAPVWTGEQGIPESFEVGDKTSEIFQDIGKFSALASAPDREFPKGTSEYIKGIMRQSEGTVQLSPARMEAAIRQVIPNNIFTNIMGAGYRQATAGIERELLDPMEKELVEKVKEFPGARRFLGFTSPHGRFADHIRDEIAEARAPQVAVTRQVDAFTDSISKGVEDVDIDTAMDWIQQEVPFEMQKAAADRLVNGIKLEEIFKAVKYRENQVHLPTRRWWKQTSGAPPAARAALLVEHISAMGAIDGKEERQEAKRILNMITTQVPGFNWKTSDAFAIALDREMGLQGMDSKEFFE